MVGSVNRDWVMRVMRVPRPSEAVTRAELRQLAGGKGANQAVAAARLGAAVSLVGAVGDDEAGRAARADLAREGSMDPTCGLWAGPPETRSSWWMRGART